MIEPTVGPPVSESALPSAAAPADPLRHLVAALFRSMGVDGVYARTALYSQVLNALEDYISRLRDPKAEALRFPPVMSRKQLEKSGYLKSFPNLLGCVCALHGSEAAIRSAAERHETGGDWTTSLSPSDLVLSPAACYPVYPIAAERGRLPEDGLLFDIEADCFRHEPSPHLDRLQSFRMREFVRIGSPEEILEFRERWIGRAPEIAGDLGLPHTIDVASDPFFGRVGQVMAISQRQQALKFEMLIPFHADRDAHRVHELQLSSRALRHGVGYPRQERRYRTHELRGLRHRPPDRRPLRRARSQLREVAGANPPGAQTLKTPFPGVYATGSARQSIPQAPGREQLEGRGRQHRG